MNLPSGAAFSPNERHLQDPVGFGRVFLGEELVTIPSEEYKQVVRFPKPHRLVTPLAVRGEDCVHLNGDLFDAHAVVEPVPVRPKFTALAVYFEDVDDASTCGVTSLSSVRRDVEPRGGPASDV